MCQQWTAAVIKSETFRMALDRLSAECAEGFYNAWAVREFLAGKRKCAICWQPGPLTVFQLVDKAVADLAWNDLRAFCVEWAACARASIDEGGRIPE